MRYEITAVAAAPPEDVWRALTDIERWPRWMSSYNRVRQLDDGPLRVGCRARVAQPGLKECVYEVTSLHAGREFTWENHMLGIRTIARHVVRGGDAGGTLVALTVTQTGPLALVMRFLLGKKIRQFLAVEANGLVRASQGERGLRSRRS